MDEPLRLSQRKPQISELMLGGAGIAGMFHVVSHDQAVQTLQKAVELGITQFDTAPVSFEGIANDYFTVLPS
jgi:aryl-alcohol dehydrogenase-like predicted oxidoreductase